MPKICNYPEDILPQRSDFIDGKGVDPREKDEILFHAYDIANVTKWTIYNKKVRGYTLLITGVLANGIRANLIIKQIPIYFDVKLNMCNNHREREEIVSIVRKVNPDINWEVVEKYPGIGFSQHKVQYLRLFFDNQWSRKKALKDIRSSKIKYETASDIEGSLIGSQIIEYEWSLGDWSLIRDYECFWDKQYKLYNIFIDDPLNFVAVNRPLSAEPPLCRVPKLPIYFHIPMDIEVNGTSDALPSVTNRDEVIFMLSGGVYRSDKPETPVFSFTITHMDCMRNQYEKYMKSKERDEFMEDDQPDWTLILTRSEEDTLLAYAQLLGNIQPEFRSQFNGYNFDDRFICHRIKQYGRYKEFINKLSIIPYDYTNFGVDKSENEVFDRTFVETRIKLEAGVFDNSDNKKRLHYVGSINIDIMCAMKKANPKDDLLAGHALRAYLERYGLPKKIDMSIADMNRYYYENDGWGLLQAADYCTVDALSCHRIQCKVDLFKSYMTLAHLALCTMSDSALRAGGMKVKNVIYCFGKRMELNYSENTVPERIESKYPGAWVFPPIRGRYTESPVICLDYSSLYPSIMRAMWTSAETFIDVDKKPKLVSKLEEEGYDIFHFSPKWDFESADKDGKAITKTISRNVCYVRKHPDGKECMGVYPKCLEFLTNIRKMYKKKMAKAMDRVAELEKQENVEDALFEARLEENDFNQKQLAVKIISNTIYGKVGSTTFNLYNPFIASSITLMGQRLIKSAARIAENKDYKVLYGDSVTGDTPIIVKVGNRIVISRFDELVDDDLWEIREDGKEYLDADNVEVWEVDRFVKVRQIIRHKTDKNIIRVSTNTGVVDTTTDHSLIDHENNKISPNEVIIGKTRLLRTSFDNLLLQLEEKETITLELAYRWGVYMANSSYGLQHQELFYNNHDEKVVPSLILHSSMEICNEFLKGFWSEDGCRQGQTGLEASLGLWILIKKCGYKNISLTNEENNPGVYKLYYTDYKQISNPDVINDTCDLKQTNDYVYDLSTETERFHAGVGEIVVHNTDSIFCYPSESKMEGANTPQEKVDQCEKLAENDLLPDISADIREITKRDTDVVKMELDKLLYPVLFVGKKKYCGTIYEGKKKPHDYISGMEYVKRGKSKLLVDMSKEVVKQVLDLDNNKSVLEMVLEVFKLGVDRVRKEPPQYFIKKAKYRTGKEGFLTKFIDRMKEKVIYNSQLYQLPDPNTVFEYIITAQTSHYHHNGTMRKPNISDKMEFRHVVEELHKPIDYFYYIEDVIGALARFICYEHQFNVDIDLEKDSDIIDKKSNENAKKFLKERLNEFMGISKLHHTLVKRQSKRVNAEHTKQYGEFIHYLFKAYDKEVEVDGIVNFIIECTQDVPDNDDDVTVESGKKEEYEDYIQSREGKLKGVYSRYIADIERASKEEVDDLNKFNKSSKISSSTKKICYIIDELKYINSLLKFQPEDDGGRKDLISSNADPIMKLLLRLFNG